MAPVGTGFPACAHFTLVTFHLPRTIDSSKYPPQIRT